MTRDEAWSFYEAGWLDGVIGYSETPADRENAKWHNRGIRDGLAYRKTLRASFDATWDAAERERERDDT